MPLNAQGCRHRAVAVREVAVYLARGARPTSTNQGLNDYMVDLSCRHLSAVPGCFLRELHAGSESKFGVDVGEVSLHGAR
jgi:hypothetical protein